MYQKAAELIRSAKRVCAFTGAGISVESGIPPFRGKDGLWNKYDPKFIEIDYFHEHNQQSWILIKEIFYDFFGQAKPNAAHKGRLKNQGLNCIALSAEQEAGQEPCLPWLPRLAGMESLIPE